MDEAYKAINDVLVNLITGYSQKDAGKSAS